MLKKTLAGCLVIMLCLGFISCSGSGQIKKYITGKWIGKLKNSEEKIVFIISEDGTCQFDDKTYNWKLNTGDYPTVDIYDGDEKITWAHIETEPRYKLEVSTNGEVADYYGVYYREKDLETIEITITNWDKYFAEKEFPMITYKNDFEEYIGAEVHKVYAFDDKYGEVCTDLSNVAIEYTCDPCSYDADVDYEKGTYKIKNIRKDSYIGTEKSTQTSFNYLYVGDGGSSNSYKGLFLFHRSYKLRAAAMGRFNVEVLRAKGSVYVFKDSE